MRRTLQVRGRALQGLLAAVFVLALTSALAGAETLTLVTDQPSYNVGSEVRVRAISPVAAGGLHATASILYAGDSRPVASHVPLRLPASEAAPRASGRLASVAYGPLWRIPAAARAGRYEIRIDGDGASPAASFAVYRKLVQIEKIDLGKTFYTSGDLVACALTVRNLTRQPLKNARLEFSDRYWPWIAGPADQAKASIVTLAVNLSLRPGETREIRSAHAAVAAAVKQPTVHQYGVVIWNHDRQHVLDIAFSPLTLIRPPGEPAADWPHPYPGQYPYPTLDAIRFDHYRHFYPAGATNAAINFDTSHTMFANGSTAEVHFALRNPTAAPWRGISIRAHLLGSDGREVATATPFAVGDLDPSAAPLAETVEFKLPATDGLYRAEVVAQESGGNIVASSALELAANSLPKSIMIFCAHEDDEGGWSGMIRAAVENHIPLHFVYFTGGDAGSCDRYYQRSCSPAEALNFGAIRMDETRAVLGHLGVPRSDIYFLGLPDGGSGKIWYDHVAGSNPYVSVLLASDHAPYENLYRPNLAYSRQSVVEAVKELIRKFQPEAIVTAHPPAEGHIDHIVNNYFVVQALQELQGALSAETHVYVDRVYEAKTLPATPYRYASRDFYISGEAAALAQEAGWYYQSQGASSAEGYLRDFDKLPRSRPYREVLDWNAHQGWNNQPQR